MIVLINYADKTFERAQKYNSLTAKKVGKVDLVREYSADDLPKDFTNKHEDFFIVGDRQIGKYGLWRPIIVRDAYNNLLNDGDFLVYADSGTYFINDIHHLTNLMDSDRLDILVFEIPFIEKEWTKRDIFILTDADVPEITETNQRMSTCFILRKSVIAGDFVNAYYEMAINNPQLFSDEDNKEGFENYCGFVQNRHNQSVLSVLTKKMGVKAYRDPTEYGIHPHMYNMGQLKDHYSEPNYEKSPYPQILVQHRSGEVTLRRKIQGFIRSKLPEPFGIILREIGIILRKIKSLLKIK